MTVIHATPVDFDVQKSNLSRPERERGYHTCPEERENTIGVTEEIEETMDADGGDHFSGDGLVNPS